MTTKSNTTDTRTAGFHMVMLDGSAMYSHEIYNFTQLENGTFDSATNTIAITGLSTVTMSEAPVHDVGTEITIA